MANHPVYLPQEPHELYKGFLSTLHTKPLFAPMVPSPGNGWSSYPCDWLLFSLFRSRFRCYLLEEEFRKHCSFSSSTQLILCPVTWTPWYWSALSYGIYCLSFLPQLGCEFLKGRHQLSLGRYGISWAWHNTWPTVGIKHIFVNWETVTLRAPLWEKGGHFSALNLLFSR